MIGGLRDRGWTVEVRELDDSFPEPTPSALEDAERALADIAGGTIVAIDGLACSAMPAVVARHRSRLSIVPIVHSLIAAEVGIDRVTADRRAETERRALDCAAQIAVTGRALLEPLAFYGIERSRISVVAPGVDRAPLARGSGVSGALHFVTVATLNPGKGHEILFRALSRLTDRRWRLTAPEARNAIRDRQSPAIDPDDDASRRSCETSVNWMRRPSPPYATARTRSSCPPYPSHAGSASLQTVARGLPVVSTVTGAIPDLVGYGDDAAGLLVPPGDVDALADALKR
jgi:glycosyltransferase involved in cell wall biosynthesis